MRARGVFPEGNGFPFQAFVKAEATWTWGPMRARGVVSFADSLLKSQACRCSGWEKCKTQQGQGSGEVQVCQVEQAGPWSR